MKTEIKNKLAKLRGILRPMDRVLVAFSGGVDSSLLLKVSSDVLGDNVLAVIAVSASLPKAELAAARGLAGSLKIKLATIKIDELVNQNFIRNDAQRCYWCKKELFSNLWREARRQKINFLLEGSNVDDLADYRPGRRALAELKVRSPLLEAGFSKVEIRELAKFYKIPVWDKPAMACLASRVPYGVKISAPLLRKISRAEEILKNLGLKHLRVRDHGGLARIEVPVEDFDKIMEARPRREILARLKKLGYKYITMDIQGYRTGSLNEALTR